VRLLFFSFCLAAGIDWGQPSDAPLRFEAATLRALLLNAHALKDYQLQTPGWMESEQYDVSAVTPQAAKKPQVDEMLRMA
jgi:uncharacterized protein (TIGR03435 family)